MSLNYVMLGSNDVPEARVFYDALLPAIGGTLIAEHMPHAFCYELRGGGRMWVATPFNDETAEPGNGTMVGLACARAWTRYERRIRSDWPMAAPMKAHPARARNMDPIFSALT